MQIASFQNYSMMEPEMPVRMHKTSGGFNFRAKQWRNVKPSVYAFIDKDAGVGDRDVNERETTNSENSKFLDSVI